MNISGDVTDRIDGSPISGSTVRFAGPDNKTVSLVNGRYTITDLTAGNYEVLITGPTHVDHKTLKVPVSTNDNNVGFTVLEYGSSMFGVTFDKNFEQFFDAIARCAFDCKSSQPMIKWDPLPKEIYVTEEGLPEKAMNLFMAILNDVNNESIPSMFGGKIGPLPIVGGPPIGDSVPGKIMIRFWDQGAEGSIGCLTGAVVASCGVARFDKAIFELGASYNERKYVVAHEIFHAAGATHAYNMPYSLQNQSLMGGDSRVTRTSTIDKFAFWLKHNDSTKPGNTYPDTNPTR